MANDTVDKLNAFLRGEISAADTYRQAIDRLSDRPIAASLSESQKSHELRALLLKDEILRRHGEPTHGAGVWGAFAKLIAGGAKPFPETGAILALEEGENAVRDEYQRELPKLEPEARTFLEQRILPEQLRTNGTINRLKKQLAAA